MFYQGFWNYRIWPVGTRRLLAAVASNGACCEDVPPILPPEVQRALGTAPDRTLIYADWLVCPITREQSGVMQQVCIEHADHIVARR
jgi:hypothetical protein